MPVTVTALASQPYRQQITVGSHTFYSDASQANGGQDTAPDPHQLLLGALGACTAMTLQMYAQRHHMALTGVTVTLDEKRVPKPGSNQTMPEIQKHIQVEGSLTAQELQKLESIAERCPVNRLIMDEKVMNHQFEWTA